MSPHPTITPAAVLPLVARQNVANNNDPYGISSLYDQLTAMYPSSLYPGLYSTYDYSSVNYNSILNSLMIDYSSLLGATDLASLLPSTGLLNPTIPGLSGLPTPTRPSSKSTGSSNPTSVASTTTSENSDGLSSGAKIGIGVGVTLAVLLLGAVGILLWCLGKRKGKKSSTTVVAPAQTHFTPQQQQQQQQPPQQQQFPPQQHPQMTYAHTDAHAHASQQPVATPPPQYAQPQPLQQQQQNDYAGAYGASGKGPAPNVAEMEHQYHFAKPGAVEIGDGVPESNTPAQSK